MNRPILLLEINEIPWRLIDRFKASPELPNLHRFFSSARTYTTVTVDTGELSPWITWPSMHRGMSNTEHGVKFLGQDVLTYKGTPIWEEYRKLGRSIGIFGSLQSWPPVDPGQGGFYIPDTFAHDERCIPAYVEPFQKYNLGQIRRNGRVVSSSSLFSRDLLPLAASLPRLGITPRTLAMIAQQLVVERLDKVKMARRPVFQGLLCWDIFKSLYDPKAPPAFSTFFTNHVAGVMHRYWDSVFPEDFGDRYGGTLGPYFDTMRFALRILDGMLADAMEFQRANPEILLVWAASMGQETIHRNTGGVELAVSDTARLMATCGLAAGEFNVLLAMVPQVAVEIADPVRRDRVKASLDGATTPSGSKLFRVDAVNDSLSITVVPPGLEEIRAGQLELDGRAVTFADAGVRVVEIDPGTAYHIPEGTMAVLGRGIAADDSRSPMSARDFKRFVMDLGGIGATPAPS
jgi:hypothetical protein